MKSLSSTEIMVVKKQFQMADRSIESLMDLMYSWLLNKKATIIEKTNNKIIANHEKKIIIKNPENIDSILGNWDPLYWKKKIIIELIKKEEILLKIKIISYDKTNMHIKERWWTELIEDFVTYMDLKVDNIWLNEIHSNKYKQKKITDLLYTSLPQIFFFLVGLMLSYFMIDFSLIFVFILLISLNQIWPIISRMYGIVKKGT